VVNISTSNCCVRTLVVDDHKEWRHQICSMLATRPDLQVVGEAADGLEAVRQSAVLKPDLILLDIGLPGMNGIETASRLHQQSPGVKILFVSGNNDPDVIRAALSDGALGYVRKVDICAELLPAIETILRGDRFCTLLLT
jgi:DNA-binding NarL/FixJ family response regulator